MRDLVNAVYTKEIVMCIDLFGFSLCTPYAAKIKMVPLSSVSDCTSECHQLMALVFLLAMM